MPGPCYTIIRKREGKPEQTGKEKEKMMQYGYYEAHEAEFEAWQEYIEWLNFEADMATNPYRN